MMVIKFNGAETKVGKIKLHLRIHFKCKASFCLERCLMENCTASKKMRLK